MDTIHLKLPVQVKLLYFSPFPLTLPISGEHSIIFLVTKEILDSFLMCRVKVRAGVRTVEQ
jgi:hypothetical protein